MSGCRNRQDLTFQYPCSVGSPSKQGKPEGGDLQPSTFANADRAIVWGVLFGNNARRVTPAHGFAHCFRITRTMCLLSTCAPHIPQIWGQI